MTTPSAPHNHATHRFSSLALPAVFALLAAAICAGGYLHYLDREKSIRGEAQEALAAMADFKARQIALWVDERRRDAETMHADRFLAKEVRNGPTRDLRAYLAVLQPHLDYRSLAVLDTKGNVLAAMGAELRTLDLEAARLAAEAVTCGCVVMSDIQRDAETTYDGQPPGIHLDFMAPLKIIAAGKERVVGVLLLRNDPQTTFYPLVRSWPAANRSAETLLVQADGQDVVFLNAPRHQPDAALTLRMPLESDELPAALLDQALEAVVEGIDYRGVPVLAAMRPIPDTPWSLVVQVDTQELLAPLRLAGRTIAMLTLLLVVFAAAALSALWLRQRTAAHARESARAEQADADRKLEASIHAVTQELQTTLLGLEGTALQMHATLADRLDVEHRQSLAEVRSHLQAMAQRIDALLAFTRLSGCSLVAETVPMPALFQAVYDELRAAEPGRQVRLELKALPSAQADPAMVREVIRHLLDNAFKFTRPRKTAKLEVGCLAAHMGRDGYRTFYVKDNGVGFDMQRADKLFGIFQRLHATQAFEGNGMGLSIVQQVVARHGGRVWAQSSVDDGAIFFFTLPSLEK